MINRNKAIKCIYQLNIWRTVTFFDNIDTLLYDFNLKANDTLRGYLAGRDYWFGSRLVIIEVDSVLIGNQYRKRWKFSKGSSPTISPPGSIIEGIGNVNGLLEPIEGGEMGGDLICFKQNGIRSWIYYYCEVVILSLRLLLCHSYAIR